MSILVSLISEFQDRGFRNASKQAGALEKTFKRLAITLGSALSIRKITQFGKASVKAFTEDNRAASALTKTLENLGLGFQAVGVEQFIASAQKAASVSDDYLRPAMSDLLRATQSVGEAQQLLNLALDISAGTGKELRTVTTALSRAYLGNNTSLGRLNAGLSKAFLASASFEEIQAKLTDLFAGDAKIAAETYDGQLQGLRISADEARETIGEGLVQAIEILGEGKGIEIAQKKMEGFAQFTADLSLALAGIARDANKGSGGLFGGLLNVLGDVTLFNQLLADARTLAARERLKLLKPTQRQSIRAIEGSVKRIQQTEKGTTLELTKQEKLRAEAAKLTKASAMLDLEKIQIEAALQGELTDNERLRLQLMKAVANENVDRATTLAAKLAESQTELSKLQRLSTEFKPSNPFEAWLDAIERMRQGLASIGAPVASIPGATSSGSALSVTPSLAAVNEMEVAPGAFVTPEFMNRPTGVQQINITVQGTGGLDNETKQAVVDAVVEASSYGLATGWFRTVGVTPA